MKASIGVAAVLAGAVLAASSAAWASTLLIAAGGGGGGAWFTGDGGAGGFVMPSGGFSPAGFDFSQIENLVAGGLGACGGGRDFCTGGGGNGGYGGGQGGDYNDGGYGGGYGVGGLLGADGGGRGGGSYVSPSLTLVSSGSGVNGRPGWNASANGLVDIGGQLFTYTGTIQNYVVPVSGLYDIIAVGAEGASGFDDRGGYGALMSGQGYFNAGTDLEIVVGGGGGFGWGDGPGGGGGGGSFVFEAGGVPEPSVWAMLLLGVGLIGLAARRRREAAAVAV